MGKPIRGKAEPPPKIGRPTKEEQARREAEEQKDAAAQVDRIAALRGWHDLVGKIATIPVEAATEQIGEEFNLQPDETRFMNDAVPLYVKHRLGFEPEGDKVFDYYFWGTMTYVIGRRLMAVAVAYVMKKTGWVPPHMRDKTHDASDIRNEGDGKNNPGPTPPG